MEAREESQGSGVLNGRRLGRLVTCPHWLRLVSPAAPPVSVVLLGLLLCPWLACRPRRAVWGREDSGLGEEGLTGGAGGAQEGLVL